MPTYEYKCEECGHRFEAFQNMTDEPLEVCPECSGFVKRLIGSGAGIIFKGSGFYCTDYRSDSYKQQASKDGNSTSTKQSAEQKTKTTKDNSQNTTTSTATKETATND